MATPPTAKPKDTYKRPSVEVTVYLSPGEASRARAAASAESRSLSNYVRALLVRAVPGSR